MTRRNVDHSAAVHALRSFTDLGLSSWLVEGLNAMDMRTPTPVQAACIPAVLDGRDVVGAAETGTGKTAAFALPILQALATDPQGLFAVILTPTRELAFQISQQFSAFGAPIAVRVQTLVGGVDEMTQAAALARKPHIVVGTPGRTALLLERNKTALGENLFQRTRYLVVDEADRLLEPEYLENVASILDSCSLPSRQTLLFSATMTANIEKLNELLTKNSDAFRYNASENRFATVRKLRQSYAFMPVNLKEACLVRLLKVVFPKESCIIFVSRCDTAEQVTTMLRILGMRRVAAMHSEMKQILRVETLQKLKRGSLRALVATDVASRGLDIPQVEVVVNYDVPRKTSTYVHRVGRTARAGRKGLALTFVTQSDVALVHAIEGKLQRQLAKFDGLDTDDAMQELSAALKARQLARMELTDSGFIARYDTRREESRTAAKKRKLLETSVEDSDESSAKVVRPG